MSVLESGRLVAGKYRIERLLGSGGMGDVYLAHDQSLDRKVALKVVKRGRGQGREARARFLREARVTAGLRSRHAVTLYEAGHTEEGDAFLVLELLRGETLARRLEQGRLPSVEVARLGIEACEALAEAHAAGIVHRDLKTENIMLVRAPSGEVEAKLLDFGLARDVSEERLTRTGALVGTARSMSPEQVEAAEVTAASDVWSLGVALYEALSGRAPYAGATSADVMANIASRAPEPLAPLCPDAHPELVQAISACLSRAPEDRPTAEALRARLLPIAPRVTRAADPPAPPAGVARRRRSISTGIVLGLAALAAVAVVGGVIGLLVVLTASPARLVASASVAPPTAEVVATSAPSVAETAPAPSLAESAAPGAPTCECKAQGGPSLCAQPQPPMCACADGGRILWDTEAAARANDGKYQNVAASPTRPGAEGARCEGWLSMGGAATKTLGVLECSVCSKPTRTKAQPGAACRGYHTNGMLLDGRWACEAAGPPQGAPAMTGPLCECRSGSGLCTALDAPECQCECTDCGAGYMLHATPELAEASPGEGAGFARNYKGSGLKSEDSCRGYWRPRGDAGAETHAGKLVCSVCRHVEVRKVAPGARCHGFNDSGQELDGFYYCDVPADESVRGTKCKPMGPDAWRCHLVR